LRQEVYETMVLGLEL